MKVTHRVPVEHLIFTDPITPAYQAEIDRSTEKAERLYREALRRLQKAERSAERATAIATRTPKRSTKQREAEAWALVELRREELAKYERLMVATGQSATHRGRQSFRPVPITNP